MNSKAHRIGFKAIRAICAPLRALGRARNCYIRSMNSIASHSSHGDGEAEMSCAYISGVKAGSFGGAQLSSGEEDIRELIRVNSRSRTIAANEALWRSRSVAVGRIDEDEPCDFAGETGIGESLIFPRSRTCAGGGRRAAVMPV